MDQLTGGIAKWRKRGAPPVISLQEDAVIRLRATRRRQCAPRVARRPSFSLLGRVAIRRLLAAGPAGIAIEGVAAPVRPPGLTRAGCGRRRGAHGSGEDQSQGEKPERVFHHGKNLLWLKSGPCSSAELRIEGGGDVCASFFSSVG